MDGFTLFITIPRFNLGGAGKEVDEPPPPPLPYLYMYVYMSSSRYLDANFEVSALHAEGMCGDTRFHLFRVVARHVLFWSL